MPDGRTATGKTLRAARRFSRRGLLRSGLAAGALTLAGCQAGMAPPARSGPRRLNVAIWSGYLSPELLAEFTGDTGIEVATTSYRNNGELLAKLRAGDAGG